MVAYITPVYSYPTVPTGTWGLVVGAESNASNGQTYVGSGYLQVDWGSPGAAVTGVAASSPAAGSVTYTIDSPASGLAGKTVVVSGITGGTPSGGYSNTFTVTATSGDTFTVANSTTGAATLGTARVVVSGDGSQLAPSGVILNLLPQTDVREISVRRGRTRDDQSFDVGVMTVVLDNKSGQYDPDRTNGIWQRRVENPNTVSYFQPGTYAELVYSTGSGAASLTTVFTGYLESAVADHGIYPTVTLTFVDALAAAGKTQLSPRSVTFKAGQTTTQRCTAVLDAVGLFPGLARSLSGSRTLCEPVGDVQGSALEIVESIMVNEFGRVFVTRSGAFKTVSRLALSTASVLTLSDAAGAAIEYSSIDTLPGHLQLVNKVVLTHDDGRIFVQQDIGSIARYGIASSQVSTQLQTQSDINSFASFLASRRAYPSTAIASVVFELRGLSSANVASVAAVDLSDLVTVRRVTTDGRTLNPNVRIEGISFTLSPDSWTWQFYTSAVDNGTY